MSKLKKQKTGKKILLNLLYICLTIGVIVVIGFLDPSVTDFFSPSVLCVSVGSLPLQAHALSTFFLRALPYTILCDLFTQISVWENPLKTESSAFITVP